MNNFTYCNPTRIVFGKDSIAQLAALLPAGGKIMITYGGGSIKKNGVYDQVKKALAGREVVEFGGIEPNPLYETLMQAVELGRRENVTFLLAVGGGSVLDGTKFIAAAIKFAGSEPWDILTKAAPVGSAVPIGTVLTLPATGSESNPVAVISRKNTSEKLAFASEHVHPVLTVLDPQTTFSLPIKQVRNGIIDAYIHVVEQYLTTQASAPLQDRQAEGILLTLIEQAPAIMKNETDYLARANFMWCATQALNGLIACGVPGDWATHLIGHELTAFYGLDHAETLAIVLPSLLRNRRDLKAAKLLQYARRVWNIQGGDDAQAIEAGIRKTEEFFHSMGMPTRLAHYSIDAREVAKKVSDRFAGRDTKLGEDRGVNHVLAAKILAEC